MTRVKGTVEKEAKVKTVTEMSAMARMENREREAAQLLQKLELYKHMYGNRSSWLMGNVVPKCTNLQQ